MTGKLGGHAGPVMTVLLKETNKESIVFTGSRDHYVKVRRLSGILQIKTAVFKPFLAEECLNHHLLNISFRCKRYVIDNTIYCRAYLFFQIFEVNGSNVGVQVS